MTEQRPDYYEKTMQNSNSILEAFTLKRDFVLFEERYIPKKIHCSCEIVIVTLFNCVSLPRWMTSCALNHVAAECACAAAQVLLHKRLKQTAVTPSR